MSEGAQKLFNADAAIGITGIAGPGSVGGKPAGTVYVSVRYKNKQTVKDLKIYELCSEPDRETVRRTASVLALEMLLDICKAEQKG